MRLSVQSHQQVSDDLKLDLYKVFSPTAKSVVDQFILLGESSGAQIWYTATFNQGLMAACTVAEQQDRILINHFTVREVTRRRGVGRYLLESILSEYRAKSFYSVSVDLSGYPTDQQLALKDFLSHFGFKAEASNHFLWSFLLQ